MHRDEPAGAAAPAGPPSPRLILVEGLPGSGKTSTAVAIADLLARAGVPHRLVLEGDLTHPADVEQAAFLTAAEHDRLLRRFPEQAPALAAVTRPLADGALVGYAQLARDAAGPLPPDLLAELEAREFYELPLDRHLPLRTRLWAGFVSAAAERPEVHVLECCFIQNPVTVTLLRDDAPEEVVQEFVSGLAAAAAPLRPLVVYLDSPDLEGSFARIDAERPREWHDFFVHYLTRRGLGRRLGVEGVAGTLAVLRARQECERRLLAGLGLPVAHLVCDAGPEAVRDQLAGVLAEHGLPVPERAGQERADSSRPPAPVA